MATKIPRRLDDLVDVDTSGVADDDRLVFDDASGLWVPRASSAGMVDAGDVDFTPAGNIAAGNVQDAIEELDAEKAASAHVHSGGDITSGTVADARIAATIARDAEVTAAVAAEASARDTAIGVAIANLIDSSPGALDTLNELAAALGDDPNFAATVTTALAGKQPLDSDLTAIAALTTTSFGRGLLALADAAALLSAAGAAAASHAHAGEDITSGTVADARIASTIARDSEVVAYAQPLDSDLTAIAALTTTSYGRSLLELANQAALQAAVGATGGDDPVADVLGTPDSTFEFATSSLTGLTAIGTCDAEDAHTTIPGHYYVRDDDGGYCGRYCSTPSIPFTVVTKLTDFTRHATDGYKIGLFIGDSSPALSGGDADIILVGNASYGIWVENAGVSNIVSSPFAENARVPVYLAIRVNSASDVDFLWSRGGRIWIKVVDSRNTGASFTIATAGIVLNLSALGAASWDYLRFWNSAKAFPGALA